MSTTEDKFKEKEFGTKQDKKMDYDICTIQMMQDISTLALATHKVLSLGEMRVMINQWTDRKTSNRKTTVYAESRGDALSAWLKMLT